MKQIITYRELENTANDISQQMEVSPAFKLFNKEKISRFFDRNRNRLEIIIEKRKELISLYVKHERGQPVTIESDGVQVYDFDDNENKEKYMAAINEFMNRTLDLNF